MQPTSQSVFIILSQYFSTYLGLFVDIYSYLFAGFSVFKGECILSSDVVNTWF